MIRSTSIYRLTATAVVLALWFAAPALAQRVYIDIHQPSFEQLPVAIPDFKRQSDPMPQLAGDLARLLADDLGFTGIFHILDPRGFLLDPQTLPVDQAKIRFDHWRRLGADFLVRGQYQVAGEELTLDLRLFDAVAGRRVVGTVYRGDLNTRRQMVQRFAEEILFALTGERGIFRSRIAFVQQQDDDKEIFTVDFDGSNPVAVTRDQGIHLSPAWNPAGTRLAYVGFVEGHTKIFVDDLVAGTRKVLCAYPGLNAAPAWRPGHDQLAVTLSMGKNPDIYLVNGAGAIVRQLTKSWAIDVSPSWSPDGNRLAYVSSATGNPQVYVLDMATGRSQRLTYQGTYNTAPAWSPQGDWIAYAGLHKGHHHIFVIRPDGGGRRMLTGGANNDEDPTWSPDGRLIAFSSDRGGNRAIWVKVVNGQGLRRLTHLSGEQRLPDWSPRIDTK